MGRFAGASMVLAMLGCGDNVELPSLAGSYVAKIDEHEKPCGTRVDEGDTSDPFFVPMTGWKLDIVEYPDEPYPILYRCWVHTTEPCNIVTTTALDSPRWNGWDRVMLEAHVSERTDCSLGYGLTSVTAEEDRLIVEVTWHKETGVDPALCTEAEALARSTSMPCYKHEHVEAPR